MKEYSKKRITRLCLILAVLVLALTFLPIVIFADLTDATTKSYEDQISEAERKRDEAGEELSRIWDEQTSAYTIMWQLDQLIERNEELKRLAEDHLNSIDAQIGEKNQEILDTEALMEEQQTALLNRMRETYMEQSVDYIEILLDAESLFDFLKKLDYVDAVLSYDQNLINSLASEKEELEAIETSLTEAKEKQIEEVARYEAIISENESAYDQKLAYATELANNERAWLEEYTYAQAQEDELQAELSTYLAELAEQQRKLAEAQAAAEEAARTYSYNGTNSCWPLQAGVTVRVSSEQGWRRIWGINDFHRGIDLACPKGTEIYAYSGGQVIKSAYHYSYGNYVVISHGNGLATLYAHMADRQVSEGDYVAMGQLVGHVGLTGSTSGYHLHFEVQEDGVVVNPRNYLTFP